MRRLFIEFSKDFFERAIFGCYRHLAGCINLGLLEQLQEMTELESVCASEPLHMLL